MNRRQFLQIAGLVSMGYAIPRLGAWPASQVPWPDSDNVLIVVFDAFSGSNASLHGYARPTMPHLERLADRAIVYHNHIANANFTTPATASLLTGTQAWTHRAFDFHDEVSQNLAANSIFHAFSDYHRLAYTHNPLANTLLRQFVPAIDDHTPLDFLYLHRDYLVNSLFAGDADTAAISVNRALKLSQDGHAYSLYLSRVYDHFKRRDLEAFQRSFPLGIPNWDEDNFYVLEEGIDWLAGKLSKAPQPFLAYYHFYPPHDPYLTRADFHRRFANDDFVPVDKPRHIFGGGRNLANYPARRRAYDEFVLYVDAEFARLHDLLSQNGLLDNTWVVFTSDHGEMFERDILGHLTPVLYQPVIHIPLVIFPPGQPDRQDIFATTSAVDILPTLASVTGHPIPAWSEGSLLPPFAPQSGAVPDAFALQVEGADARGNITQATATVIRDRQKLIHYFGYEELSGEELIEFYDLEVDPQELTDLYPSRPALASQLLDLVKAKINEASRNRGHPGG